MNFFFFSSTWIDTQVIDTQVKPCLEKVWESKPCPLEQCFFSLISSLRKEVFYLLAWVLHKRQTYSEGPSHRRIRSKRIQFGLPSLGKWCACMNPEIDDAGSRCVAALRCISELHLLAMVIILDICCNVTHSIRKVLRGAGISCGRWF